MAKRMTVEQSQARIAQQDRIIADQRDRIAQLETRLSGATSQSGIIASQRDRATAKAQELHAQLRATIDALALLATGAHSQLTEVLHRHADRDAAAITRQRQE